ncbi:response regulator [Paucibacter sp. O1-1]|nr:response regulator [Paucibacter sp. O1-1]MDA3831411.1 response regulator [Paucibacter sp. O1-1]
MQAVELAQTYRPQIILMDIRMPDLDGVAALEQIRAIPSLADTRVVAVTASSLLGEEERLRERFDGYVRKPISREVLFAELRRLWPQGVHVAMDPAALTRPQELPGVLATLEGLERETWPALRASLAVRETARLADELAELARAAVHAGSMSTPTDSRPRRPALIPRPWTARCRNFPNNGPHWRPMQRIPLMPLSAPSREPRGSRRR